jgi:type VI secretion system protein ImpE
LSRTEDLWREGRLADAIGSLNSVLRDDPTHVQNRVFLFELLCFAGEYDRADNQLDVLAGMSNDARMGALNYRAVLSAERTRQQIFEKRELAAKAGLNGQDHAFRGTINGRPFRSLTDVDPRIGSRLELFAAGDYLWIPFRDVIELNIEKPKRLRDLLWSPVKVRTGPAFRDRELTNVFMPVLYPHSWEHPDDVVRLGRSTEWCRDEDGEEAPFGQKMVLADGEEFPILEIRTLHIETPPQEQCS